MLDRQLIPKDSAARALNHGTYYSVAVGREQPYSYLLPESSGHEDGGQFPLLVLLHGLGGNHMDWATKTRLARYAAAYEICIAFPEGGTGWYTNAYDGSANYEDDLIDCFLPHLQATLPLLPPGKPWAIGGLSMGGYGAIKTALRRSDLFGMGMSTSGSFDAPRRLEADRVFGDPKANSVLRRASNIYSLVEDALSNWPTTRPRLYFDCGVGDELLTANQRFHQHLNFLGYHHTYIEMPGYHTWPYWDRAIRTALPEIAKAIGE